MKRLPFLLLLLVMAISFFAFRNKIAGTTKAVGKYEIIMQMVAKLLTEGHYDPKAINDEFSKKVFNKYLEDLDPEKNIFLKRDVDSLANLYADKIDDELKGAEVKSFIGISKVFDARIAQSAKWATAILATPFNYTTKETVQLDGKMLAYPLNDKEREERWRKKLKYHALERYVDLLDERKANSGKKDYVVKNDEALEKAARVKTDTVINRVFTRYRVKFTEEDKFNMFVDNIATTMDPHTEFFPPADKSYFNEEMSGSFFGIGAGLQYEDGSIKIISINSGSPAAKSGELAPGDIITKVGQGNDEPVDLMGYFVQDAVKLIRGKEGSKVKLTIKKPDGSIKVVELIRAKIDNDLDTYARSAIITDSVKKTKIGVIYLPEFYAPYLDPAGRRSYTDVAREIQKLKDEKVDGIIMDLRRNGGGSLYDVVQMVGLFIDDGPIVQVKDRQNRAQVLNDEDRSVLYTGPLAVMVDEFSASASEIFAAAIQDYKRGVIIGSTSTFGKGTVQQNVGIDRTGFKQGEGDLGALKLTLRKYYRINGGSTQLKGVASDIVLPSQFEPLKLREKDNEYALKYDEIGKSNYTVWNSTYDLNMLKELSKQRLQHDSSFQVIKNNSAWLAQENNKNYSLNIDDYRNEKKMIKAKVEQIAAAQKLKKKINVSLLPMELNKFQDDTGKQQRLIQWIKGLSEDIYLNQAMLVVDDMVGENNIAMKKTN